MPFKSPQAYRDYLREYMRRRRKKTKPAVDQARKDVATVLKNLNLTHDPTPSPT